MHWRNDGHGQEGSGTGKESFSEESEKTRKAVRLAVCQYSLRSVTREKVLETASRLKPNQLTSPLELSVCGGGALGGCCRSIICNEL